MAVVAVVALAVGLAAFLVLRPGDAQPKATPPDGTNPASPVSRAVTEADLRQQVDADRSAAEGLVDHWVAQLSSKRLGLTVHGVTFGYQEILADFQALHTRFPRSVLIRSDDYSTYGQPGYWITVLAELQPSSDAANAWCDANGIPAEDCFAHFLSHTRSPADSSKTR